MKRYIIAFVIFSFAGWVWESIYCTVCQKKWANRGFLYGPVCPIYGFASLVGIAVYDMAEKDIIPALPWWGILAAGICVSAMLEYPTSFVLEKIFHARWWDYSDVPLNLNGRISLPTSIGFGCAAILILRVLLPLFSSLFDAIPDWLSEIMAFVSVAVLSADLTLTVSALTDFQKKVKMLDDNFQSDMTGRVAKIVEVNSWFGKRAVGRIKAFRYNARKTEIAIKLREERLSELFASVRTAIKKRL